MPLTLFTPLWLLNHDLLNEAEAETAEVHVISPQITRYDIGDWGKVDIRNNRLVISTISESHHEVVKDIVASLITAVDGNELNYFGINFTYHLAANEEQYLNIGKILAPFENWNNILDNVKMERVEMVQEDRADDYKGKIRIRVQPSGLVEDFGVEFRINNHFERSGKAEDSSAEFISILNNVWNESHKDAEKKLSFFIKKFKK